METTLFVSPFSPGPLPPLKDRGRVRDRCAVELAHELWLGEIRAQGHMEALARKALERDKPVRAFHPSRFDRSTAGLENLLAADRRNSIRWVRLDAGSSLRPPAPPGTGTRRRPVPRTGPPGPDPLLIHYTRRQPGPWPGQTLADYLKDIVEEREDVEHTAADALNRILAERRIRGGSRLTRGPSRVVSFTELLPGRVRAMTRWHPALGRWTFEPYGVAFPKAVLQDMGAVPVIYGDDALYNSLPEADRYRFQMHDPSRTDWSAEREWRLLGDLVLDASLWSRMHIIVPAEAGPCRIQAAFDVEVWYC